MVNSEKIQSYGFQKQIQIIRIHKVKTIIQNNLLIFSVQRLYRKIFKYFQQLRSNNTFMNHPYYPIYILPCGAKTMSYTPQLPQNTYFNPFGLNYPVNLAPQVLFQNSIVPIENLSRIESINQGNFNAISLNQGYFHQQNQKTDKQLLKRQVNLYQKNKDDKTTKRKYSQNPKRNVITNLGNQILSFVGNKFKIYLVLLKISQKVEQQTISSLLIYIRKIRKEVNSYLNIQKMRKFWFSSTNTPEEVLRLFRKISYYYLTIHLHLKTIKSSKMKTPTRMHHLNGIRQLVAVLKNNMVVPDDFDD